MELLHPLFAVRILFKVRDGVLESRLWVQGAFIYAWLHREKY
jgi:hypothetical protein